MPGLTGRGRMLPVVWLVLERSGLLRWVEADDAELAGPWWELVRWRVNLATTVRREVVLRLSARLVDQVLRC